MTDNDTLLDYLRTLTVELADSRARIAELEAAGAEDTRPAAAADEDPVVVVGMACRAPGGVRSPEQLWQVSAQGTEVLAGLPGDRGWPLAGLVDRDGDRPGTSLVDRGGFVEDAAGFDPMFFGISPREAMAMDPQQRVLLETAWHALEDAGIAPDSLRGSDTATFAGLMHQSYGGAASPRVGEVDELEGMHLTGVAASVASGRISYLLGLQGPAVSIDTACSSSLVAVHLAVRALRAGDCDLALAGGATIMALPEIFTEFSRQRGLAPDGRIKPFAAAADGTAWSEGAGMVVLERLSAARRHGHRVLAVIAGSAVNQDGASNGLTAPNGPSQERVIADALRDAGWEPSAVTMVQAHGTGTRLGDPIEAGALTAAYGSGRPAAEPLLVTSAKGNLGHTQAAAGILGMILTVTALNRHAVPHTINVDQPTPHHDWSSGVLQLVTEPCPWPPGRPYRAAVSSFGMSGTNAHVLLAGPDAVTETGLEPALEAVDDCRLVRLSAATPTALRRAAEDLASWLAEHDLPIADVARTLADGRAGLPVRAGVVAADPDELLHGLRAIADPEDPEVVRGRATGDEPARVAFVFPGQGSQWPGMARDLLATEPVFASAVRDCRDALAPHVDWDLIEVIEQSPDAPSLDRVDVVQPAVWAVMVSLARLWIASGVEPAAVVGHSQGEIAAAVVAGALSLQDGALLSARRSRALREIAGRGGMVSVVADVQRAAELLEPFSESVSVAAVNGPASTVVAGDPQALESFVAACDQAQVRARHVPVDYASHTRHVDAVRDTLLADLASVQPRRGDVPFFSTVEAEPVDTETLDADYWFRNLRQVVRFDETVQALQDDGVSVFLEISPHPVLTLPMQSRLGDDAVAIGTLRRDRGGTRQFLTAVAEAWVNGVASAPHRRGGATVGDVTTVPGYPFEHERYWLPPAESVAGGGAASHGMFWTGHPLLGAMVAVDEDTTVLTGRVSAADTAWVADHAVSGVVVLPGAAVADLALAAGRAVGAPVLTEVAVTAPVFVGEGGTRLRLVLTRRADGDHDLVLSGAPMAESDPVWSVHARGVVARPGRGAGLPELTPPLPPGGTDLHWDYALLADLGYEYGPAFAGLRSVRRAGDGEPGGAGDAAYAVVELPEAATASDGSGDTRHVVHPALLDACLHPVLAAGMLPALPADRIWLPYLFTEFDLVAEPSPRVAVTLTVEGSRVHLVARQADDDAAGPGRTVFTGAVEFREASRALAAGQDPAQCAFLVQWRAVTSPETASGDVTTRLVEFTPPLPEPGSETSPAQVRTALATTLAAVQDFLSGTAAEAESTLLVHTRHAVAVEDGDAPADPAAAAVCGLVRSAQTEEPGRIVLLDAPAAGPRVDPAAVLATGEPQLAVRSGRLLAPRLRRHAAAAVGSPLRPDATVLITGGLGTLGLRVAEHLVATHQVRNLLLLGRSAPHAEAAERIEALRGVGVTVRTAQCDVAVREDLEDVVAELFADPTTDRPITAVVHAAGVLADATIAGLDEAALARVLAPKIDAALYLDELTAGRGVDAFVLFSSIAGVLGTAGQANYAAANAALDALAARRRSRGESAVSLAWGFWSERSGMTGHLDASDVAMLDRTGIGLLGTDTGLALLDRALAGTEPTTLVTAALELGAFSDQAVTVPSLLTDLVAARGTSSRPAGRVPAARTVGTPDGPAARLAALGVEERLAAVLEIVVAQTAAALHLAGDAAERHVAADKPFKLLGIDSLTALDLRNRLAAACEVKLPATLIFDRPTPAQVAEFVAGKVAPSEGTATGGVTADSPGGPTAVSGPDGSPEAAGRSRLETAPIAEDAADDPVVVVGAACRLPGGIDSREALWQLLRDGGDVIGPFPTDRGWPLATLVHPDPDHPRTSYVDSGGFVADAADFDAEFFGISPREALAMDPQQRLLLETSWHALEDAGIAADTVRGTSTGVFSGLMYHDYAQAGHPAELDGLHLTGVAGSVATGRVAYHLGTQGPAVTVDTACSSGLVATHMAIRSLRSGESDLALAGAVTLMATPATFVEFSRQRGLAPDGRAKPFAAAADGTSWSEGSAVLVLERLSDAQRNGHRVLAVLAGSAVNQDGASNGLTSPNGPAQERVIATALQDARWTPASVTMLEAHGTGTRLGDPIEAGALAAVYGSGRDPHDPLLITSAKSNLGHTQAASGIVGVLKAIGALQHGIVPATIGVDEPTPHHDWSDGGLRLVTETTAWPGHSRLRRAAVSSFGISGTNAHVLLEQAPETGPTAAEPAVGPWTLRVSARSTDGLRELAGRYADRLAGATDGELADICHSAAVGRSAHPHRAAVTGADRDELVTQLRRLSEDGRSRPGTAVAHTRGTAARRVAFLFTGQGSQYAGMGAGLAEQDPAFAAVLQQCDEVAAPLLGRSLREVIADDDLIHQTRYTQPALLAIECGIAATWRARGLTPVAVLGHSIGELAAACDTGVMGLSDGIRLAIARGRLMDELCEPGAMAAVFAERAVVERYLETVRGHVDLAAVNGPGSVTVSGRPAEVQSLLALLSEDGVQSRPLTVRRGFHSVLMEPMLEQFEQVAAGVRFHESRVPFVSSLWGREFATGETMSPQYLRDQVRRPVEFAAGLDVLLASGVDVFVEVGPTPALSSAARRNPATAGRVFVESLRPKRDAARTQAEACAALWVCGVAVREPRPSTGALVDLPLYPFQRRRYWIDSVPAPAARPAAPVMPEVTGVTPGVAPAVTGLPAPVAGPAADTAPLRLSIEVRVTDATGAIIAIGGGESAVPVADHPVIEELAQAPVPPSAPSFLDESDPFALPQPEVATASVFDFVREAVAGVLGQSGSEIDVREPVQNLGLDSMMALELRRRIETGLDRELSLAAILDGACVAELAALLGHE